MRVEIINNNKDLINSSGAPITPKRRVVAYARVSTEKDEQLSSYESQIDYYTHYIKSHDDYEYIGVYADDGISGTSTKKRLGFQKMMKDALKGKFNLIITKSISRFARNTLDSLMAIRKLKENNVEIYFEKENIWTFDSKGELLITIMSSIAQEESRSISMNVTWGIRQKMKQGQAYVPYKVFLGYDKGKNGDMVINEEQAKIVRRIFAMAMQDKSEYSIAKTLEEEHAEFSPGVYKWHTSTIKSILRNEKYKGDAIRQKTYTVDYLSKEKVKNNGGVPQYYIHNHHPAIIPPSLFDRLQEALNNRIPEDKKRSRNYLFSKKIVCGCCGAFYGRVVYNKGTDKEVVVWRCNNKYKRKGHKCKSPTLKESFIKEFFVKEINKMIPNQLITIEKLLSVINRPISIENNFLINNYMNELLISGSIVSSFCKTICDTIMLKMIVFGNNCFKTTSRNQISKITI